MVNPKFIENTANQRIMSFISRAIVSFLSSSFWRHVNLISFHYRLNNHCIMGRNIKYSKANITEESFLLVKSEEPHGKHCVGKWLNSRFETLIYIKFFKKWWSQRKAQKREIMRPPKVAISFSTYFGSKGAWFYVPPPPASTTARNLLKLFNMQLTLTQCQLWKLEDASCH